jgi:hypothetical protein
MDAFRVICVIGSCFVMGAPSALAQTAPPAAASLSNISGCSVEGSDVFITTGQGPETRRFKYAWDASIDALCNANGFAISTPKGPALPQSARSVASTQATPAAPIAPGAAGEFPADLPKLSADALKQKVSGKTFAVKLANGTSWKLEYKSNGYYFVNTSTGFNGSGAWQVTEGQLCGQPRGEPMTCNDVRERADGLVLKRQSGEVIVLVPQ